MSQVNAVEHVPLSDRVEIDGVTYEYHAIDRAAGRFRLSINGSELRDTPFDVFPTQLQEHLLHQAKWPALYAQYGIDNLIAEKCRGLSSQEQQGVEQYYRAGLQLLLNGPNDVLALYRLIMDTYHDGEQTLKTLYFRGTPRAHYHSNASLIHIDTTGPSRGGKDILTSRFLGFLPPGPFFHYSSSSSKAAYYAALALVRDDKTGKVLGYQEDPDYYNGKVIVISEVADASGFTALKALAEENEYSTRRHQTIINGAYQTFSIQGPRCVIILSVRGIAESDTNEVKNRFYQAPIETRDEASTLQRNRQLLDNLKRGADVRDDPRTEFVTAALEILYHNGFEVRFEQPDDETSTLLDTLVELFTESGFNTTQIGQFYSLCECAAFQKRYYRGCPVMCRIEVEDVCESWYLVRHFAKETVTKLSEAFLKVFDAVKPLTDEELFALGFNPEYADSLTRQPTQADLVRRTGLAKSTVSKALNAENGALINANLVYNEPSTVRGTTIYRRTERSEGIAERIGALDSVMCSDKCYQPRDPVTSGVSAFPGGFHTAWKLREAGEIPQSDVRSFYEDILLEFPRFQDNKAGEDTVSDLSSPVHVEVETGKPHDQKDGIGDGLANGPNNGDSEVSEGVETKVKPSGNADLTELTAHIKNLLKATKSASSGDLALFPDTLARVVCKRITKEHPQWRDFDVLQFYTKLAETDPTINGLIADCTGDI